MPGMRLHKTSLTWIKQPNYVRILFKLGSFSNKKRPNMMYKAQTHSALLKCAFQVCHKGMFRWVTPRDTHSSLSHEEITSISLRNSLKSYKITALLSNDIVTTDILHCSFLVTVINRKWAFYYSNIHWTTTKLPLQPHPKPWPDPGVQDSCLGWGDQGDWVSFPPPKETSCRFPLLDSPQPDRHS